MVGRKFRNLRQAVQRTHNCGITTEIVAEQELDDEQLAELTEVVRASTSGAHTDRGFHMNLDGVLEGRFPGIQLIIARDASGKAQGFHRYATAGGGSDITLDVPWRRRGAPNGIDERLSIDMIMAAKEIGAQRVSLAFAAFPEIFDEKNRGRTQRVFYRLIHCPRPVDRARVVVPIRAQVPRAGRPALRADLDDPDRSRCCSCCCPWSSCRAGDTSSDRIDVQFAAAKSLGKW